MKLKKVAAVCAALGVAAVGALVVAPAANADPVSNSYVLAGSDTLQDASNAIVNGTKITTANVRLNTPDGSTLGSFDAFGSAAIQTKPGGPYFARPAGSGDGVKALSRSIDGGAFSVSGNTTAATTITGQVDIARSSSGPGTAANSSGPLAYIPFGRDAVTYAFVGDSASLGTITTAQLNQIYSCTLTTVNGVAVTPVLPQSSSGTRKFFLAAIGSPTLGSCVQQTTNAENDGSWLTANEIVPFSVASYIAQSNGAAVNRINSAQLGTPNGTAPCTGSGSALAANPTYYADTTWGRDTYVVVEYARIDSTSATYDASLAAVVNPANTKSLTNFSSGNATSGAVKKKFGFLAPSTTAIQRANLS